jgi:hypothetical protein
MGDDERQQEWADGNGEIREALRTIHRAMLDKGLLTGSQDDYWYSMWDAIVSEIAPELAEE